MSLTERNILAFNAEAYRRIERLRHNRYNYERYVELRQAVIANIPEDAQRLLDIGSNVGTFEEMIFSSARFARSELQVIGLDVAERCIEIANRKGIPNSLFLTTHPEILNFADNTFDVAVMIEVIEHVEAKRAVLAEVHRVLKPGGQLILTTPNADSILLKLKQRLSPSIYRLFQRPVADIDEHINWSTLKHLLEQLDFQIQNGQILRYPQLYGMSYKGKKYGLIPPLPPSLYLRSAPALHALTERYHFSESFLQRICFTLFVVAVKG